MSIFDIIIASLILFSTLLGAYKGLIKICLGWASMIGGILIAYLIFPFIKEILIRHVENHRILNLIGSALSYFLAIILLSFLFGKLETIFQVASGGFIDRLFGATLGFIRGYFIGLIILIATAFFSLKDHSILKYDITKIRQPRTYPKWLNESTSYKYFDIGLIKMIQILPKDILKSFNIFKEQSSEEMIDILKRTIPQDVKDNDDEEDLEQKKLEKDNNLSLSIDELF